MAHQDEEWQRVEIPYVGLAFGYPRRTPSGQAVELDDVRPPARSEDDMEAYFELSRHLDATAPACHEEERDFLAARCGAEVTPLTTTDLQPSAGPGVLRHLRRHRPHVRASRGRALALRRRLRPWYPLNLAMLETIRIE